MKVLITDANYKHTLGAIRSLGKKGIHVIAGSFHKYAQGFYSKYTKERIIYPKSLLKWKEMTDEEIKEALYILIKILSNIKKEKWQTENLKEKLITEAEKFGNQIKGVGDRGFLLWPFRVALTGREMSPPPFEIAEIFGKEKTLKRINEAIKLLEQ